MTGATTFGFGPGNGTSNEMGPTADGNAVITRPSLTCLAGLVNTNVETLTAADGSLTLTSHDLGCIAGPGTFHGTGTWTVTGGTGGHRAPSAPVH